MIVSKIAMAIGAVPLKLITAGPAQGEIQASQAAARIAWGFGVVMLFRTIAKFAIMIPTIIVSRTAMVTGVVLPFWITVENV